MRQYEKYYRGFNSQFGSDKTHLMWITDSPEYASEYGDTVEEIIVDEDLLEQIAISDMPEYIDYHVGPDEEDTQQLRQEGYNCYGFEAGDDMYYCYCLWDKTPIKSRRVLPQEELDELIRNEHMELGMEESNLKNIFKRFVNEIVGQTSTD